jgi:hypothetical protein
MVFDHLLNSSISSNVFFGSHKRIIVFNEKNNYKYYKNNVEALILKGEK